MAPVELSLICETVIDEQQLVELYDLVKSSNVNAQDCDEVAIIAMGDEMMNWEFVGLVNSRLPYQKRQQERSWRRQRAMQRA